MRNSRFALLIVLFFFSFNVDAHSEALPHCTTQKHLNLGEDKYILCKQDGSVINSSPSIKKPIIINEDSITYACKNSISTIIGGKSYILCEKGSSLSNETPNQYDPPLNLAALCNGRTCYWGDNGGNSVSNSELPDDWKEGIYFLPESNGGWAKTYHFMPKYINDKLIIDIKENFLSPVTNDINKLTIQLAPKTYTSTPSPLRTDKNLKSLQLSTMSLQAEITAETMKQSISP